VPKTPDDLKGGITDADQIVLNDTSADPTSIGEMTRNGNDIRVKDGLGVFSLRQTSVADVLANVLLTTEGGLVYGSDGDLILKG
jgi:hypothetical protein